MTVPLALACLACLSAVLVRAMIRRNVLDIPNARSSHDRPTPKGGGIGILAAFATGLAAAWLAGLVPHRTVAVVALLAAALLVAAAAWADDIRHRGAAFKLAAQVAAALILVASGDTIARAGPLPLGLLSAPITLVWLVAATNAVNFIDGLNGLASGCTLIAAAIITIGCANGGDTLPAAALLPLAAGIAGFMPFNYPRARIFMGDVGSQLCGLVLAAMAGPASRLPGHPWGVLLVPMAMAPILADVAFTLARRWRAGDPLTDAHRGHLYQLANRAGSPASQVTLAFWSLTMMSGLFGLHAARARWPGALVSLCAAAIPIGTAAWLVIRQARRTSIGRW